MRSVLDVRDETVLTALEDLAREDGVVALGECGLDYNRNFSEPAAQRYAFEAQLELAAALALPVYLHERDAHEDFLRIPTRHRPHLVGGLVHCFTGQGAELDAYLGLDMHVGITGWISDPRRGRHLPALVRRVPADRLMIETDAPFLTPPAAPTRRNESSSLPYVLEAVARARDLPVSAVARDTTAAARQLFRL